MVAESNCSLYKDALAKGEDMHKAIVAKMKNKPISEVTKEERQLGKTLNYGILYGMQPVGLASKLKISKLEAEKLYDEYWKAVPDLKAWVDKTILEARVSNGVTTKFGRYRSLEYTNGEDKFQDEKEDRRAVKYIAA